MPDTPNSPSDERPVSPDDPTVQPRPRRDTLAASSGSDFQHGRFVPGQMLGERYRIVARLGEGGMGEVYRADDLELGQSVALKFLPEKVAADDSWLRRFRNEVRTARQVAHANVCRIYDIGQEDGHVFLSMEYVDGEDLAGVLRRLGRPSREKAIEIARQICLGLAAAHESNVLHRDLKPQNIMIDGRGRVRITDFGLAGFLDELEGTEARAGTPAYMAPEQLARGMVSVRSDIYSLGLILHELFTGRSVFDTDDVEEIKRRHSSGSVSKPSSTTTDEIDPAIERLISRCLEPRAEDRPQSVYQILVALPGGDPLAAALAAGETPSPELVANARDADGLSPRVAIGLVAALFASVAIMYVISSMSIVMPEQSPARLSVVAEQVMEELGYHDLPRFSVSGYDVNMALAASLREEPHSLEELQNLDWPPKYRYWRRWSDGDFLPTNSHAVEHAMIDAPTDVPDRTITVALDSRGRLLQLTVPPAMVDRSESLTGEIDWTPLFSRAGLNSSNATQIELNDVPSVFCDTFAAWQFDRSSQDLNSVTVLVGASAGRLTYFKIVGLDNDIAPTHAFFKGTASVSDQDALVVGIKQGSLLAGWVFFLLLVILAVRNLRAGRVDHRNAFRCALLVGGLYALLEIMTITVGGSEPVRRIMGLTEDRAAGHILMHSIQAWVLYLAIEPYVRRIWPRMLIGLVRVFSGRWRDPAVGAEILVGLVTGCVFAAVVKLVAAADWAITAENSARLPQIMSFRPILSLGHFMSNRAHMLAWGVLAGITTAGLIVLIRALVRYRVLSMGLSMVAIAVTNVLFLNFLGVDSAWGAGAYFLGIAACLAWLLTRIGVLSAMAFFFVLLSSGFFGLSFDAWSTPYLITWLAMLFALAGYAFWVSLAGQPIFIDMLAEQKATT